MNCFHKAELVLNKIEELLLNTIEKLLLNKIELVGTALDFIRTKFN
jgi:hypothetical protein